MLEHKKANILLGYSGHGYVVAEAFMLSGGKLTGYSDATINSLDPLLLDYMGNERDKSYEFWHPESQFILGLGDNILRTKVSSFVRNNGCECAIVIHPSSSIALSVSIGTGTFIARNVAVNPMCKIGTDVILNTSSSIDHECIIKDGSHIAPGAVLAGNVVVGHRSFIGANCVVKQGVTIGDDVVIGAGSVVLKDVASGSRLVGNPARII